MFSSTVCVLSCLILALYSCKTCTSELLLPSLVLFSPGEPEYTDVLVKRVHDNLTLACKLQGDITPRHYVWNYMPGNESMVIQRPFTIEPAGATAVSKLTKRDLQLSDSGQYMCSAPPFSVTKYILVQARGPTQCARGAFSCGAHCVLAAYVCDGRTDCPHGEDEDVKLCSENVCARSDKINCTFGRCISEAACCKTASALCQQPACCDEHPRYSRLEGYVDVEYPPLFEDRHAPDDYGFIQSTIYTVTACALIFMIAVVLLVSAICKMHMKRAALRSYAHADRATRQHYNMQYAQAHRFPPCYEASRLLEDGRVGVTSPAQSPHDTPTRHSLQCSTECPPPAPQAADPPTESRPAGFGLARLSAIFSSRYRQVPTQPPDVEMTSVRPTSLTNSPTRTQLQNYRSPTYCDLDSEFYFTNPETPDSGRDLNFLATPVEFFRQRTARRNTLERVMDQIDRQRLTLQLGRFQFTLPSFSRDRRPDTPNVAEINIDDLDFIRSADTYTLNGRTIRLLGANFENYPVLSDGTRPPPYTEAMRYKLYGPPPEYLSREGLNGELRVDEEARNNVEMPPCYDDLAGGSNIANSGTVAVENNVNNNVANNVVASDIFNSSLLSNNNDFNSNIVNNNQSTDIESTISNNANVETLNSVIDNLPAIDSDVNANDTITVPGTGINNVANNTVICNGNE